MDNKKVFRIVLIVLGILAVIGIAYWALKPAEQPPLPNGQPAPPKSPWAVLISGLAGSLFGKGTGNNQGNTSGGCSWWQKIFGGCGGNNFGLPDCDPNHIGYTKDGTYDARCTTSNGGGCVQGKPSADDPCIDECGFVISSDVNPACGGRFMKKKTWNVISIQTSANPDNKILYGNTIIPNDFQIGNKINISINNGTTAANYTVTGKIVNIDSTGKVMTVSFSGNVYPFSNGQISQA